MSAPRTKLLLIYGDKKQLTSVDKNLSLEENIDDICKQFALSKECYGLKLREVKKKQINRYITSKSFYELEDGSSIELVSSLNCVVKNMIYNGRRDIFDTMKENESDPAFIDEIAMQKKQQEVNQAFFYAQTDPDKAIVLLLIVRLIACIQMPEIEPKLIFHVIKIVKSSQTIEKHGIKLIEMSLWILSQILLAKNCYDNLKSTILREVYVADIMPYIWWEEHVPIQGRTLQLLNAFVRCELPSQATNHKEKQKRILNDIVVKRNLSSIYNNMIRNQNYMKKTDNQVDSQKELGLLQSYILNSFYSKKYMNRVDVRFDQFGCIEGLNADEILESINAFTLKKYASTDTLKENDNGFRFSVATIRHSSETNKSESLHEENEKENVRISELTYECLVYYEKTHNENFIKSKIEERMYEPGIYKSSENVVKILAKTFNIGKEPDLENCDFDPLVFYTETGLDVFLELFSRTIWLLSKTRREMRAYNNEDYDLLFKILERQIITIFQDKPMDFKELEKCLGKHNYADISHHWEAEQKQEWLTMYNTNPCMKELRKKYEEANIPLIYKKRMNTMKKGQIFPKIFRDKKSKQNQQFKMVLSTNEKSISISNVKNEDNILNEEFRIEQIRHVIVGKACPHIKNNSIDKSKTKHVFSLQLEGDDYINVVADTEQISNYWIDGFNMLIDHPERSSFYYKELSELVQMDCALCTMELQSINIPSEPPKLPHPVLPPKPSHFDPKKLFKSQGRDAKIPLHPKRKNSQKVFDIALNEDT